ncbi:N-acetylglucosamine-6-phosphate deacetylase [Maricaulis maris]|uniref:N-acetylglucosamine 6-phosphate deacetylase n=1 Tax=Maricaulis maris TaxID=74318 RepID=A0A495DDC6_9PROT|nr:N-acetylglucosamine-6-phosphate deacetylase [Maricaulis maris]RKR00337.1 N-acetylglucosamine 6-phosphate deacetylase [Maricaulis maris]
MRTVIAHARILTDTGFQDDASILLEDGRVLALNADTADADVFVDFQGDHLVPGFFDIQVNGGGGVLFNDTPDVEGLQAIARAHLANGTTSLLPTLISDTLDVVDAGMRAVEAARDAGETMIAGIHIEGPFLNPKKCGIHDPDRFIPLDDDAIALLTSLRSGRTLVTLAPEMCRPDQVRKLVEAGVTVSLGHTNGRYADAQSALAAGATGFTHLFNAMPQMHSREPGIVGAALESGSAWTSLIVDGHHVDPVMLKLASRLRPADKLILITDAMPNAGTTMKEFTLQGRAIHVADGQCRDANGVLAGAHLTLIDAVRNATHLMDIPIATALAMASANPADFMGLGSAIGRIAPGRRADFVRLTTDFNIADTWQAGAPLASAQNSRRRSSASH